jgi:MYXO-CTERM domain-containing protein
MSFFSKLTAAGLLTSILSIAPVYAQQDTNPSAAPPNTSNPATPNTTNPATPNTNYATTADGTVTRYDERRGFDWGWLGLLGLLGLFGLRKPTSVVYQDRDRTYQDRTTTR